MGILKSVPCTLVEDLRPIALTSVVAKAQESFVAWIYEDTLGKFLIPSTVVYRDHQQLTPFSSEHTMIVRSALICLFASYLNEQSHFTQFGKKASDFEIEYNRIDNLFTHALLKS